MPNSEIKIFQSEDGNTEVQVKFDNETVWLSQKQMTQLFDKDSDTIGLHLKNIYSSRELSESSTAEESSVVQIEEKAANLLYFITKNHSFTDGNKRIAAFLFLYFLERNGILFDQNRNKRIADNTLVALTLMIAVSKPEEKDTMIKVIVNLINKNN